MLRPVNLNDQVKVKLTEEGIWQFESFFGRLCDAWQQPRSSYPSLPIPDADGYYLFELWMLLSAFGGYSIRSPKDTAKLFYDNIIYIDQ